MRTTLTILAAGLVLVVAVGVPARAQAVAGPSGVIHAATATTGPEVVHHGSCSLMYDLGNGGYASDLGGYLYLFFEEGSYATDYCNDQIDNSGQFEIVDETTGLCLAVDSANGTINEGTSTACFTKEYSWDRWTAVNEGTDTWLLRNAYNGECLYDYTQEPAIYTNCKGLDEFENFFWSALP